ncbi:zinc finger protein 280C [Centroberyx affinis]|uniref:zinc finger protein 280C n=1 Tax=Centroberyx affinis TaxID=166261 RepID=UPI003A5C178A
MSELFMECEEEELEPWQKQVPQVNLVDDDDDEPIFVGELTNNQRNSKPNPAPLQRNTEGRPGIQSLAPQPARGSAQIVLPLTLPGKAVNTVNTAPPSITTITPQPVIVNNQGFIVTSPQLSSSSEFIASLGKQYPPGTSFTILPAGQQHLLQQVTPATLIPGVVHRPQVQQINNNIVTLSNVQSPAVYSTPSNQLQPNRSNSQSIQIFSLPVKAHNNRDQSLVKRALPPQQNDSAAKRTKFDLEPAKVVDLVENGIFRKKCPKCKEEFLQQEAMKCHMMSCCAKLVENVFPSTPNNTSVNASKRIMLVSDFYYGRFEGDRPKQEGQKTNTTFKCQSCLKVLKNNIRFMNHMKHHLELEKQNSESWESHTTCQHCYRQYMTPFQLQCHIESAHSPFESSTNCKICELAFESEQVLLEHMKDNHKPGEMPYVCQVCNYRSSFFSEVETHFRSVHENTKDLLCPFCLKVLRSSHIYMQHYMKHQKKGIHRCGKCRLNFLTYKEKLEHKTHVHKTFRKPKALEGLPPGTKVTIRASVTGKTPILPNSPERSGFNVSPEAPSFKPQTKAPVSISKSKSNISGAGKAKPPQIKKQERRTSKHNVALRNLRVDGGNYTCIECDTKVADFFSHYPMAAKCGACKYRTSCKVSFGNHMIRFHSAITKNRFWKMENRKNPTVLKLTLVCLNCDLIVDASGGDMMSKHLTDRPNHVCKVIQEKADIQVEHQGLSAFGEPSKVIYIFTSVPAEGPKKIDVQQVESVPSGGVTLVENKATVDQPEEESEQSVPAADRDNGTQTERSPERELKHSLLPSLASSTVCKLEEGLPPHDESLGDSVSLGVGEQVSAPLQPPVSLTVLNQETGTAQSEVNNSSSQSDEPEKSAE